MKKFESAPFKSGSRGLDQMVKSLQSKPKKVVADDRSGVIPRIDAITESTLDLIERIGQLSPQSPGAKSIPEAVTIGWSVVEWLQEWSSKSQSQATDRPGTLSIEALAEGAKTEWERRNPSESMERGQRPWPAGFAFS